MDLFPLFNELSEALVRENKDRERNGNLNFVNAKIKLLGQFSLLANQDVSSKLTLAGTVDLDAIIKAEYLVNKLLNDILQKYKLVLDTDSHLIWIPPRAEFIPLYSLTHVNVDHESALLSKAIKAKEKNKILIQEALKSELFPNLKLKISSYGGDPSYFLED